MSLLSSLMGGLYDYAMQDRPDLQQLQAQGGAVTPSSPMDQLNQSMMNAQAMQAQAGMPQSGYSQQMSMSQAPNQSPVNPMGNPEIKGLMELIANRMEQNYAPRSYGAPSALMGNTLAMTPAGTGMMGVGPSAGQSGGLSELLKLMAGG